MLGFILVYMDGGVSGFLAFFEVCAVIDLPDGTGSIALTGSLYEVVSMQWIP